MDLDLKANLTRCASYLQNHDFVGTIAHILDEETKYYLVESEGCDILPSTSELYLVELSMVTTATSETLLKTVLTPLLGECDYILIYCNPNLEMLAMNALTMY